MGFVYASCPEWDRSVENSFTAIDRKLRTYTVKLEDLTFFLPPNEPGHYRMSVSLVSVDNPRLNVPVRFLPLLPQHIGPVIVSPRAAYSGNMHVITNRVEGGVKVHDEERFGWINEPPSPDTEHQLVSTPYEYFTVLGFAFTAYGHSPGYGLPPGEWMIHLDCNGTLLRSYKANIQYWAPVRLGFKDHQTKPDNATR